MNHDDDLTRLIQDTADGIEPHERLAAIRAQTRRNAMTNRNQWWYAVAGAAAATLVIVGGLALLSRGHDDATPPVVGQTSTAPTAGSSAPNTSDQTPTSPTDSTSEPATELRPVYYFGATTWGPRLFQELHAVPASGTDLNVAIQGAVHAAMTEPPADDAYYSPWPAGADVTSATYEDADGSNMISIALTSGLAERPAGMPARTADLAVQQLVWTATEVVKADAPVQFFADGKPMYTLLGVPVGEPLAKSDALKTLNHISLLTPLQGSHQSGSVQVTGLANSFEANVKWELIAGDKVVDQGNFTCDGWMGDKLFPFHGTISLAKAGTGDVLLRVSTDDPSGGAEGHGPFIDDKLITVS